jgi:RNA polymerase sigma-70 factor (ECF subfamily)
MLVFYLSMLDEEVDKRNFEQIYLKYHEDILRRTYNILRNDEDVKDAMQEIWFSVLKSMPLFRDKDEGSIRAYIMSIARNQSISILRKKRKEVDLFRDIESMELIDDEDLFEICEIEGVSRVMECVNMLSATQKDIIIMYYLYHRSLKEIAKLFNISEVVAKSRWNHGRERLMKLLMERGIYVKKENDRA